MAEKNIKILVIDDEINSTILLRKVLEKAGYETVAENNSQKAIDLMRNDFFDIIVSDLQMPEISGLDLLKNKPENSLFIMITGYGSVDTAVESMKLGAFDYINKPFNLEEFILKVDKAAENIKLNSQLKLLRIQAEEQSSFSNIVGKSKPMQELFEMIRNVSRSDINVLVEGESGTGKELVARAIHFNSSRKEGPFVAINCSAIPDNLLESELFGHTKGAYTGAVEAQKGVFELANGGTLLLDEIAEMPYTLQSKLLRVIETWEIKPLGSDKVKKVDVRLISATNRNLNEFISDKKFREDLFYRIATVNISLPPLCGRKEDIPLLVEFFLKKFGEKINRNVTITADAMNLLITNSWHGNVRELENAIERAVITSDSSELNRHSFRFLNGNGNGDKTFAQLNNVELKEIEKLYIKKTLDENNWNKLRVSKILGIDRKTLYKKIKEYGLE